MYVLKFTADDRTRKNLYCLKIKKNQAIGNKLFLSLSLRSNQLFTVPQLGSSSRFTVFHGSQKITNLAWNRSVSPIPRGTANAEPWEISRVQILNREYFGILGSNLKKNPENPGIGDPRKVPSQSYPWSKGSEPVFAKNAYFLIMRASTNPSWRVWGSLAQPSSRSDSLMACSISGSPCCARRFFRCSSSTSTKFSRVTA